MSPSGPYLDKRVGPPVLPPCNRTDHSVTDAIERRGQPTRAADSELRIQRWLGEALWIQSHDCDSRTRCPCGRGVES